MLQKTYDLPSLGGATSISVMSKGFFGSQATAALHLITWPWLAKNWKDLFKVPSSKMKNKKLQIIT